MKITVCCGELPRRITPDNTTRRAATLHHTHGAEHHSPAGASRARPRRPAPRSCGSSNGKACGGRECRWRQEPKGSEDRLAGSRQTGRSTAGQVWVWAVLFMLQELRQATGQHE